METTPRYQFIKPEKIAIRAPNNVLLLVDIYPVGFWLDVKTAWRCKTWSRLHLETIFRHVRKHEWRSLKNHFNGYLAEPDVMPGKLRRCGSGWTRKRALRNLKRRVRRS